MIFVWMFVQNYMEMITGLTSRSKLEETIKGVIEGTPVKQPFIVQ